MKRIKLSTYEKWIEAHSSEYVKVPKAEYDEIAKALAARKKDAVLNIRINSADLNGLKGKARKAGVRYQTFISEILHRAARA